MNGPLAYTPAQVAEMLQLNKNTVYELINRGELVAKKFGKVYRIPRQAISFLFSGLDYDLFMAEREDKKSIEQVSQSLSAIRLKLK